MKRFFYLASLLMLSVLIFSSCKSGNGSGSSYGEDPDTGSSVGARAYLPVGWYVRDACVEWVDMQMDTYSAAGDAYGPTRLEEESPFDTETDGVHVIDRSTFETTLSAFSLNRPKNGYYASKTYYVNRKSFTFYFYFATYIDRYEYKIENDILYVTPENEENWQSRGPVTYENGVVKMDEFFYMVKKVNFNGTYDF